MLKTVSRRKLDEQVGVIGLDFCLVSRFVTDNRAATVALMDDDISLFGVGQGLDRAQDTAAIVCSVTGIYVNVQGAETEGAVIARGVSQGEHLFSAVFADKTRIVLFESLVFHSSPLFIPNFKFLIPKFLLLSNAEFCEYVGDDLFADGSSVKLAHRA